MFVKIGDKIYDPRDMPIMLILSAEDKRNIANMPEHFHRLICSPVGTGMPPELDAWSDDVPEELLQYEGLRNEIETGVWTPLV